MKHVLVVLLLLAILIPADSLAQIAVTPSNGNIGNLSRGYLYTLNPDPNAPFPVTPVINSDEDGNALRLVIRALPGVPVQVHFTLPTILTGDGPGMMPCSFSTNSVFIEETNHRHNPNLPFFVSAGVDSTITMHLGLSTSTEGSISDDYVYSAAVACVVTDSSGFSVSTGATYQAALYDGNLNINSDDGYIAELSKGYTYTLNPDWNAPYPVTPVINGDEEGEPVEISLVGTPGTTVTVSFKLPPVLVGYKLGVLPCEFPANSVYVDETGERWDPNAPRAITFGANGEVLLLLGIRVTVPPGVAANDEYYGIVTCIMTEAGGGSVTESAYFFGHVIDKNLAFEGTDGSVENVSRGYTYTLNPDPTIQTPVTPVINGDETGEPMRFQINGNPGSQVEISFNLPQVLLGNDAGALQCSFASNSAMLYETWERWDPQYPHTITFGWEGSATFLLGITPSVPPSGAPSTYSGAVVCIVSVNGGSSVSGEALFHVATRPIPLQDSAWVQLDSVAGTMLVLPMVVSDDSGDSRSLTFGLAENMSPCIVLEDIALGYQEAELPPVPPVGVFDARLRNPRFETGPCFGEGSMVDLRPAVFPGQRDTFYVAVQEGLGGRPIHVSWPSGLDTSLSELRLVDPLTFGSLFNINMLTDTSFNLPVPFNGFMVLMRDQAIAPDALVRSVNGMLYSGLCDSVRVTGLTFNWDTASYSVVEPNWSVQFSGISEENYLLPFSAPSFPYSAAITYQFFPGGVAPQTLTINTLISGQRYKLPTSCGTVAVELPPELPKRFSVDQNYPNPFNPSTTIAYALPMEATVRLAIHDVLGRTVRVLAHNEKKAAGAYNILWDGTDGNGVSLPSGVYLLQFDANEYSDTKKLILLK